MVCVIFAVYQQGQWMIPQVKSRHDVLSITQWKRVGWQSTTYCGSTHSVSSRHWGDLCTFRGTWRRIRCSGPLGGQCPIVGLRIHSSTSGMRPSMAGNCAALCLKSDRSILAEFSCTRAFSVCATNASKPNQSSLIGKYRDLFLDRPYQFFVVESGTWQYWRQTSVSFGGRHRLKPKPIVSIRIHRNQWLMAWCDGHHLSCTTQDLYWLEREVCLYSTLRTYIDEPSRDCVNRTIHHVLVIHVITINKRIIRNKLLLWEFYYACSRILNSYLYLFGIIFGI